MNPEPQQFAEALRTLADRIEAGEFSDIEYQSVLDIQSYSLPESAYLHYAPGSERILICLTADKSPVLPESAKAERFQKSNIVIPEWMLPADVAKE